MNQTQSARTRPDPARKLSAPGPDEGFRRAVLDGLSARRRTIPARYFYDHAGSLLFERITQLAEYYPTRTEIGLLEAHVAEVAEATGPGRVVVEFGSGSSAKTPLVLNAVAPRAYVPVDISAAFLAEAAEAIAQRHPGLAVLPVAGDFMAPLTLPEAVRGLPALGFFPGSTIGNLSHGAAIDVLRAFRRTLGETAWLLIGMDTRKDPALLARAYDDAEGVTAQFNRNLLERINRELDGTVPVELFDHVAAWNPGPGRVEMYLRARRDVQFQVAGRDFAMAAGEAIHTENSHKYTADECRVMALAAGWRPARHWTDGQGLFGLHLWQAEPAGLEP